MRYENRTSSKAIDKPNAFLTRIGIKKASPNPIIAIAKSSPPVNAALGFETIPLLKPGKPGIAA